MRGNANLNELNTRRAEVVALVNALPEGDSRRSKATLLIGDAVDLHRQAERKLNEAEMLAVTPRERVGAIRW